MYECRALCGLSVLYEEFSSTRFHETSRWHSGTVVLGLILGPRLVWFCVFSLHLHSLRDLKIPPTVQNHRCECKCACTVHLCQPCDRSVSRSNLLPPCVSWDCSSMEPAWMDGKHTPSSPLEVCLWKGNSISFVFFKFQNNNDITSVSNTTWAGTCIEGKSHMYSMVICFWQFKMTHAFCSCQSVGGVY